MNNVLEIFNRMTIGRAGLIGLVLAAFYYFLLLDSGANQKAAIANAESQIADLQAKLKENQIKLDRAAVYKKTAAEIGTTITKLLGVIPEHFAMTDLMKIVSNEVKVAGSSLSNIAPGKAEISKVAKEFEELSVRVDMTGSFMQHMIFLSNLTKINQILILRKFDLGLVREAKGEEAPQVQMAVEIIAYRYRGNIITPDSGKPGNK